MVAPDGHLHRVGDSCNLGRSQVAAAVVLAVACRDYSSADAPPSGADGGDVLVADSQSDGSSDGGAGAKFHDLADPARWQCFNLGTINFTSPSGGAIFDGRFVYYGSTGSTWVRFDRSRELVETAAWTKLDARTVDPLITATGSMAFDGRYLFYALGNLPRVMRFDTSSSGDRPFGDLSQWTPLAIPDGGPSSVRGGLVVKSGPSELVYTSPSVDADASIAVRYAPDGTLWEFFDAAAVSGGGLRDWTGGRFDGRFVYWLSSGKVLRFDTALTFANGSAWEIFDANTSLPTQPPRQPFIGLSTTAFDGRYVYFAPRSYQTVLRYDTSLPFTAASSWTWFDAGRFGSGFTATGFDERYVYFVPGSGATRVVRYDSLGDFTSDASWSSFDLTTTSPTGIAGFGGTGFDGRWLYLVPNNSNTTCRFDAVEP